MGSKQRFTFIFVLLSLTMTMLFFQNCSQGGSLYEGNSITDPFIVDPPIVFASKNSGCTQISTVFLTTEPIYICLQKAGVAPTYCHEFSTATSCNKVVVTSPGWTSTSMGNWVKVFSAATTGAFPVGTYTAYVVHTDDVQAVGTATFTVQ